GATAAGSGPRAARRVQPGGVASARRGSSRPLERTSRRRRDPPEAAVMEILGTVSSLSIVAFAVSSMLMAGGRFTLGESVAALREPKRLARRLAGSLVGVAAP